MFKRLMNAAFLVALLALSLASAAQEPAPDLILYNGKIFTSNVAHPYVQALAILGERISATGDSKKIKSLAGPHTKEIDLGGRTVIPGINDAHLHLDIHPANWVELLTHGPDPTWNELKAAILKAPKGMGLMGDIGLNVFYDTTVNRDSLDQIAPNQPVMLSTLTGHAAILNSAALRAVGVREDQKDPLGGRYERSEQGRLTGVLREYAARVAFRKLTDITSDADAISELRKKFDEMARLGITSIQDMSNEIAPDHCVALLKQVPTPIRVRVIRMPDTMPTERDIQEGRSLPSHPAPLITVSGTKWFLDGTPLEDTFELRQRAAGQPLKGIDQRVAELGLTFPKRELTSMLQETLENNDQLLLHVGGYPAPAAMLDAMQNAGGKQVWATQRVRFEHGDGLYPDLIPRVKEFGIVVMREPSHLAARYLAPQLFAGSGMERSQPLRSLLRAGIPVAFGSDGPVNPYLNILFATTHPDRPSEAITREQAVIAYTATSAFAEFDEKDKGTLEVGKLADLAVLSQDIFTIPAQELPKTESVLTLVGGKVVYDANVIKPIKGQSVPNDNGSPEMTTGNAVAQHIDVLFDPLPSEWVTEQNVMDPIWESLGYKGVNYYAYGRPLSGKSFAARSDPSSSLYQAWLGAYVIVGGKSVFGSGEEDAPCAAFVKLAQYDQKSWLAAMGDPHPFAESSATRSFLTIPIDGSERTGCSLQMATHSDVSSVETPLAKHMGKPPEAEWEDRVSAFHDVDLHVVGAWWYDPHRDISVIAYTASSRFKNRAGLVKDNDLAIATSLRQIMQQAKLVEGGGSTQ